MKTVNKSAALALALSLGACVSNTTAIDPSALDPQPSDRYYASEGPGGEVLVDWIPGQGLRVPPSGESTARAYLRHRTVAERCSAMPEACRTLR